VIGRAPAPKLPAGAPPEIPSRGMWSRQRLRLRISNENLVTDGDGNDVFNEGRLDPAGYRLSMGEEVYVSPATVATKTSVRSLKPSEAFFIPAGQFAFLLTEEVVRIPDDAFAFIALRSKKTKFRGLVNVSGFHADPGYHGRLIFAVFNAGPGDVHLRRGDELFTIMMTDLDQATDKPRKREDCFMNIQTDLIAPIAGEIQSLAGLKANIDEVEDDLEERLGKVERDAAIIRWATALILGALIALLVRTFSAG
jgi:dCTP deaminase